MKNKEVNLLNQIFVHSEKYPFECDAKGIVTVLEPQNHAIQRFFRKFGLRIPENKKMELDAYGSFVYLQIDGKKTVEEIGAALKIKYPGAADQLYDRLCRYMGALYNHFHYIELVSEQD